MENMQLEAISEYLVKNKDKLVQLLSKLIAAQTVNPPGNEKEAAQHVINFLEMNKIPYEVYEKIEGRTNVVCRLGEEKYPSIMLVCHLDTVPAGEGWHYPPFEATVVEDRVYGRGSVDNKGPLAAALMALATLKETNIKFKGSVQLAAVADEEMGSKLGMEYLLNEAGLKPDFVLVAEPMNMAIEIAEKGSLGVKLLSKGKQAHASMPELGINAIQKLAKVLVKLEKYQLRHRPHTLLGHPTINVGRIEGGIAVNVVPPACEAILDIRYLPSQTPREIIEELKEIVFEERKNDPQIDVDVQIIHDYPPTELSQENKFVAALKDAVRRVTGKDPRIIGIGGGTVAKQCKAKGIDAAVFGPGNEALCHVADEYISTKELLDGARIFALMPLLL
jgi:acetylornithine deacetylase/succinyl-diaminopimelate desuccinylase family protein